jgi:hypothetical protein
MDTIKNLALFGLICLAGYWVWQQKQEPRDADAAPAETEVVQEVKPELQPSAALRTPPPAPAPAPAIEIPKRWFTTKRLTLTTDTGIAGLPAGSEVQRIEDGGYLFAEHQGRRFPAKYDDLTTDESLAVQLRVASMPALPEPSTQPVAMSMPTAPQPASAPTPDPAIAERKREMRDQALNALNLRIQVLRDRITHEQMMARKAATAGRSSSRGVTIQRLQSEIDALEQQKMAIIRAN